MEYFISHMCDNLRRSECVEEKKLRKELLKKFHV